ncbi:E3 ubiquitin-protein ligase ATL23-like [Lolium perenne]|uniref:E3 ubiquitin-protein ligase ATL23-like n=1 Tax=Lolium perenne TaxID=4522 RepID=UPI0021E9E61F|nr:RING-H2 finger protein ATL39-like [Lolium perenne]
MVPPTAAGGISASPSTAMPEHSHGAKCRCRPARSACAWARDIFMDVLTAAVTLLILFGIVACLLMTPLVFAARALRRQARRYGFFSPVDHPRPRPRHTGLASEQISRLPTFESSPFDRNSACIVCLEAARGGERWRALPPCGHAFHTACVDPWLLLSPTCPVCRATVAVLPRSESQAGDGIEKPPLSLYFSPPHGG